MRKFLSLSLRTHLLLMAFLLALPAIALIIHSGLDQHRNSLHEGISEGRKLVFDIASEQYNLTGNAEQLVTVLAQVPDIKTHNVRATNALLMKILKMSPQFANIIVADRKGDVWASALPLTKAFSLKNKFNFENALKAKRFSSGEYGIGRISAKPTIGFVYPIINEAGRIDDVIAINFNFDHLNSLLERAGLPEGSSFSMLDHNGVIIDRNLNRERFIGHKDRPELFQRMKNGPGEDTFIDYGLSGDKQIISYRTLKLPGESSPYLYVRASIPLRNVLANARRNQLWDMAMLSPFLLATIAMVLLIGKYCFVNRINCLQEASQRLAHGDLHVRVSEHVEGGEIGRLGQSFDEMARQLAAREMALRESEGEYRFLADNSADIIWRLGADRRITYISPADERLRGFARVEVLGRRLEELMPPEDAARVLEIQAQRLAQESEGILTGLVRFEAPLICKNGRNIWTDILSAPIRGGNGELIGYHGVARDISERKKYEDHLLYLSAHDPLTGLYNRTHFEAEFKRTAMGRSYPFSIIIADVDGLKGVNDTKGHQTGDIMIKSAAGILKNAFRSEDLVARIGGDEFAIILPRGDENLVNILCQRVREEEELFNAAEPGMTVRLSLGGATARTPGETADLFQKADIRMYEDKALFKQLNLEYDAA